MFYINKKNINVISILCFHIIDSDQPTVNKGKRGSTNQPTVGNEKCERTNQLTVSKERMVKPTISNDKHLKKYAQKS